MALIGPDRGLVLVDFIYVEIDLKIKADEESLDSELSKGVLTINGRGLRTEDTVIDEVKTLDSRLSTLEMRYAIICDAVESTFEVTVVEGQFYGKITADTTSIQQKIVIHESTSDDMMTCAEDGVKLQRRVMSVRLDQLLVFDITNLAHGACANQHIEFTPSRTGHDVLAISCGAGKILVKVVWSLMDRRP